LPGPDAYQIPDLVGRRFEPGAPGVARCQDSTDIPTDKDCRTWRRFSISAGAAWWATRWPTTCTGLVVDALAMAVAARGGHHALAGVITHADRRSQYPATDYLEFGHTRQRRPSVGRTGTCWDCDDPGVLLRST
jgi:transposase InsO family protein